MVRDRQESYDSRIEPGTVILFADGLRFDVSQRLVELLRAGGRSVSAATQWSAHPTVTATSKPAVSPVIKGITGLSLGEQFQPVTADTERPLTTDRFRGLLEAAGYQCLGSNETGDPSGRAWTEHGEIDRLGHLLKAGLAPRIDDQIELLRERVAMLLDEGWKEVRVVTGSRLAVASGRPAEGRPPQVPDHQSVVALRGHRGGLQHRDASCELGLEPPGTYRSWARNRLLRRG